MQKYNILELNEKLLPELQSIAEELGIKKVSSLKKEELVYRILDEQAISYAGIQAEKEKEKEAKKAERQTKAKKTKAAAPKGAKADAKTKVAAPATPVEASVEEVAPEAPEQPERKRRTRIDKKEKVAAAVVPVQKNEEAAVSKSPVSANAPVSETLVQVADATADVPAETVKPAAKKVVKKTDKPVEKPLLPPVVVESDNGELPADYEKLLELKGIGHYTAGAIASIAYGIPVPAVDGNVLRILMRVSADNSDIMKQSVKTRVEQALQQVIPQDCAGSFNQALMELGAIVCVPNGEPLCDQCPWYSFCETRKRGLWQELPVKKKAKGRRIEERTVLVIRDGERVVLKRRPKKGLLAGLYEFPNEPGTLTEDEALRAVQDMHLHPMRIQRLEEAKHIFSHVEWHMQGYMVEVDSLTREEAGLLFVEAAHSEEAYPIPAAFAAYTKYMNIRLGNERFKEK